MNTLVVSKRNLSDTLYHYFAQDKEFTELYHARSGQGLEACVAYELEVHQFDPKSRCYEILDNEGHRTAFFSMYDEKTECPNLSLFFVAPAHRNKADITKIWSKVVDTCPNGRFLVGLRERNTPATKFYLSMGAQPLFHQVDPRNPNEEVMLYYYNQSRTI